MYIIHVCCFYVHIIIPSVYIDPEFLYIDPCIAYLLIAYYVHTDGREHFKVMYFVNIYVCNTSYSLLCKVRVLSSGGAGGKLPPPNTPTSPPNIQASPPVTVACMHAVT